MTSPSMDTQATSPWLSVWFKPGPTIQHIVAASPGRHLWLLGSLAGICGLAVQLLLSDWRTALLDWRWIVAILLGGAAWGIISVYVAGFFLRWSGRLLGGRASTAEARAAAAWSSLPIVLGIASSAIVFAGLKLSGGDESGWVATTAFALISATAGLWSMILLGRMLARLQNFGFWRTAGNFVLGQSAAWLTVGLLLAVLIRTLAFQPFSMPSGSMKPTLLIGDIMFVSKYPYGYTHYSLPFSPRLFSGRILAAEPQRGDVVVFRLPKDDSTDYVKRVIGLPGDAIQIVDGVVQINGKPVPRERMEDFADEEQNGRPTRVRRWKETLPNGVSYATLDLPYNLQSDNTAVYQVPAGHYFMIGDNRHNSTDSRHPQVGMVPFENLIGRVDYVHHRWSRTKKGIASLEHRLSAKRRT
jgi:signal peptidase I